ncbi:thioredoxin-like protein, partial [Serendipita vermifera]
LQNHDGRLVLVDFYADWCGPCKMISPILEKVTSDTKFSNGKEVDLITIDTDEEGALAQKYKVTALPTVIAIRDGQVLNQFVGAQPAPAVQEWVKALST